MEEKPDRSLLRIKKLLSIKLSIRFSSFRAKNQRRNYKKCLLKNSVKSTFEVKLIWRKIFQLQTHNAMWKLQKFTIITEKNFVKSSIFNVTFTKFLPKMSNCRRFQWISSIFATQILHEINLVILKAKKLQFRQI